MKKPIAMLILLMLLAALVFAAQAEGGTCEDGLKWTISKGTLTISGKGQMKNYYVDREDEEEDPDLPPWYDTKTEISKITKVVIKSGVTSIGDFAFPYLKNLVSVTIPSGVTSIGEYSFAFCEKLKTVTIPSGVKYIRCYAFTCCETIKTITIPNSVISIEEGVFQECLALGTVNLGTGIEFIGGNAFCACDALSSVVYSGTAEQKESIRITASGNIRFIDRLFGEVPEAYKYCGNNMKWSFADGVLTIEGRGAMYNYEEAPWYYLADRIDAVVIPNGVTSIGEFAFAACAELQSIDLPDSVTSVGKWAFAACTGLQSFVLPEGVKSIGEYTFAYCYELQSIVLPDSLKSIGKYAFSDCYELQSIVLPYNLTQIGEYAFMNCSGLKSISLPCFVKSIEKYTFGGCDSLQSITLPDSVTSIGEGAFFYCEALDTVHYEGTLEQRSGISIGTGNDCLTDAQWLYSQSTALSLPTGLKALQADALNGVGIKCIKIPASVETIGSRAFANCTNLKMLIFAGSPTSIADDALETGAGIVIYVKKGSSAEAWAKTKGCTVIIY